MYSLHRVGDGWRKNAPCCKAESIGQLLRETGAVCTALSNIVNFEMVVCHDGKLLSPLRVLDESVESGARDVLRYFPRMTRDRESKALVDSFRLSVG